MSETVYLREVDAGTDNACWVVCSKGDPGAVEFGPADELDDRGLGVLQRAYGVLRDYIHAAGPADEDDQDLLNEIELTLAINR